MFVWFLLFVGFTAVNGKVDRAVYIQPEQIHLSLGSSYDKMVVTWTTFDKTNDSTVWFGEKKLDRVAYGQQTLFQDSGSEKRSMYIHRVYLTGLKVNQSCQSFDVVILS